MGVLDPMQDHVHRPDPEHRRIEVEAIERLLVKVLPKGWVPHDLWVMPAEVLACRHQEPAGSGCRIADYVGGLGLGHLHHQLDDVTGSPELAILPGTGD